jgi:hypothetical protein
MVDAKHDDMIRLHEEGVRLLRKTGILIRDTERLLEETRASLATMRQLRKADAILWDEAGELEAL